MGSSLFPIFIEKEDVAIRMMITMMICGEVYMGIWLISFYRENAKWFEEIGRHIYYLPTIWIIQLVWNIVDFLLGGALYLFYRDVNDNAYHLIDIVTLVVIVHICATKLHPFVFLHAKWTGTALVMQIIVTATTILLVVLFALSGSWSALGYMAIYPIWHLYLLYLNFNWVRVEQMKRANLL